jgi:hypothetical protein
MLSYNFKSFPFFSFCFLSKNEMETDYNRPLSISAGQDSVDNIEAGSTNTPIDQALSKYKDSLLVQFGQVENFSLIYTPADLPFYFLCTF